MAEVILLCGKICSGKSWYAEKLKKERPIVVLASDELMLSLFDVYLGDKHCETVNKANEYLYFEAEKIAAAGTDVALECGFWKKAGRQAVREKFERLGHKVTLIYFDTDDETIKKNAAKRNAALERGEEKYCYPADENLLNKCEAGFEVPDEDEYDVILNTNSIAE